MQQGQKARRSDEEGRAGESEEVEAGGGGDDQRVGVRERERARKRNRPIRCHVFNNRRPRPTPVDANDNNDNRCYVFAAQSTRARSLRPELLLRNRADNKRFVIESSPADGIYPIARARTHISRLVGTNTTWIVR